ncbi:MAG: hypothetical protein GY789_09055 [Hyphomicrobiales bacterium]|nr:hypothetical protein [Hyphomicrobiales bacterium]MCP4998860.1 hypothetical protein [Hyphomicrobiales bacterium]
MLFSAARARFRKAVSTLEGGSGVCPTSAEKLAGLRPVRDGGSVTFAVLAHASDGSERMVVTAPQEHAPELPPNG